MAWRRSGFLARAGRDAARRLRGFADSEDGVTAIEFGLVATPFFGLMFAILETAMVFFGQQTLETAVANAAREIRTGQAQAQGFSANQFKNEICKQVAVLFSCASGLTFDVRTYPTFASIDLAPPLDASGNLNPAPSPTSRATAPTSSWSEPFMSGRR